jgi:hypothetical protein
VSGAGAEFFARKDRQVRGIVGDILRRHGEVVIGNGQEGDIRLAGGGHDLRNRAATVGGFRMDMDGPDALTGHHRRRSTR